MFYLMTESELSPNSRCPLLTLEERLIALLPTFMRGH